MKQRPQQPQAFTRNNRIRYIQKPFRKAFNHAPVMKQRPQQPQAFTRNNRIRYIQKQSQPRDINLVRC